MPDFPKKYRITGSQSESDFASVGDSQDLGTETLESNPLAKADCVASNPTPSSPPACTITSIVSEV